MNNYSLIEEENTKELRGKEMGKWKRKYGFFEGNGPDSRASSEEIGGIEATPLHLLAFRHGRKGWKLARQEKLKSIN